MSTVAIYGYETRAEACVPAGRGVAVRTGRRPSGLEVLLQGLTAGSCVLSHTARVAHRARPNPADQGAAAVTPQALQPSRGCGSVVVGHPLYSRRWRGSSNSGSGESK